MRTAGPPNSAESLPLQRYGVPIAAAVAATIGAVWLFLWFLGLPQQWTTGSGLTMKSNMAASLVVAACALLLLRHDSESIWLRFLTAALAATVFTVGALTLLEHFFGLNLRLDQLLFSEPAGAPGVTSPNRMGPPGALGLTLIGAGLLCLWARKRAAAAWFGIAVCVVVLVPAIGYIYGATSFFRKPRFTGIAISTLPALMSLGVGLVLSTSKAGPLAYLRRDDSGGRLLRDLLPATLVIPIVLGYLRTIGERVGLYGPDTGRALLVLAVVIVFSGLLAISAARLTRANGAEVALREAEVRFRSVLESMSEGLMIFDRTGKMIYQNPASMRIHGFDPEHQEEPLERELLKSTWKGWDLQGRPLSPDEWPMMRVFREGSFHGQVLRAQRVDRSYTFDASYNGSPLYDASGNLAGGFITIRDITEELRAQQALQRSETRLRAVLDSLPVAVWIADPDGRVVDANRGVQHIWGEAPLVELERYREYRAWWPDTGKRLESHDWALAKAITGGVSVKDELLEIETFDGRRRFVRNFGLPVRGPHNEKYGGIAVMEDITDRKHAEDALRVSEQRFRALAENIPQMLWVADAQTHFTYLSSKWLHYTGTTLDENASGGWTNVIHPDDRALAVERWNTAIQTNTVYETEYRVRRYDGEYRWQLSRAVPIFDSSANRMLWFGTITEIEDQKRSHEALIRSEKLASVGRMAATVAHEINNPLELVMNCVYLASLDQSLSPSARHNLSTAEQELERVAHLTRQTLGFYRENSAPTQIDPSSLVRDVVKLYAPKLTQRKIQLSFEHNGAVKIRAIAGEIRQVVANIVANAIDASPHGGQFRVRMSTVSLNGGRAARLTFADTGEGIRAEHLRHIFEPFFTTKESIGTGLGLWVTSEIVQRHGGKLRVRSRRGQGTVFSVFLPESKHQT